MPICFIALAKNIFHLELGKGSFKIFKNVKIKLQK